MGAATFYVAGLLGALVLVLLVGLFWWRTRRSGKSQSVAASVPRVDLSWQPRGFGDDIRFQPGGGDRDVPQPRPEPVSKVDLVPRAQPGGRLMDESDATHVDQRLVVLGLEDVRDVRRGRVGRAADGSEVKLLDRPVSGSSSIRSFHNLLGRRRAVNEQLRAVDPRIETCWPTQVLTQYDGSVDGYHREPFPEKYWLSTGDGEVPRILNLAVDLRGQYGAPEITPSQAREVVALAAKFVHVMHEAGLTHGELAFHTIGYAVEDDVSICVLDFEASRSIGHPSLRGPDPAETAWHDPHVALMDTSQDSDRYQLAVLAFRLLVTRTRNSIIDPRTVPAVLDGFDERQTSLLRGLWARAAGPRGQRPNTHEWLFALGVSS